MRKISWISAILCRQGVGGGGGGRAWGGDLIAFVGPGVGHLNDLVFPGKGIFESIFAWCGLGSIML